MGDDFEPDLGFFANVMAYELYLLKTMQVDSMATRIDYVMALYTQGYVDLALTKMAGLLPVMRKKLGYEDPLIFKPWNAYAAWLREVGQVEKAQAELEELISHSDDVLPLTDPDRYIFHITLALCLKDVGQTEAALLHLVNVHDQQRQNLGEYHSSMQLTRNGIARCLADLTRHGDDASVLGVNHPEVLNTYQALARGYYALGKLDVALKYYCDVADGFAALHGDSAPETLRILEASGDVLADQHEYSDALATYENLVRIHQQKQGDSSDDALRLQEKIAKLLYEIRDIPNAITTYRTIVAHHREHLGDEHPTTLSSWFAYAQCLDTLDAVAELDELIPVYSRVYGPADEKTLAAYRLKVTSLKHTVQCNRIPIVYKQIHEVLRRQAGADDPETLAAHEDYADALATCERISEAVMEFEAILKSRIQTLGKDHADTLATWNKYATLLNDMGDTSDSAQQFSMLLHEYERLDASDTPDAIEVRSKYARNLATRGHIETALRQYRLCTQAAHLTYGPQHPHTLFYRRNVFLCLLFLERIDVDDIAEVQELLADYRRVAGEQSRETLLTWALYAQALDQAGYITQALTEFETWLNSNSRYVTDSDVVFVVRKDYALALFHAGKIAEAHIEMQLVIADAINELGEEHSLVSYLKAEAKHIKQQD